MIPPFQGDIRIVKLPWLLPGVLSTIGALMVALPAAATQLESWQFNTDQNRLTFSTDEGVTPRVQLIANPTRLVIDLPGTTLGRSRVEQSLSGALQAVRVAQFDADTTRIVIELAPGYTLDPNQVRVQGMTASSWSVQLPTPQPIDPDVTSRSTASSSIAPSSELPAASAQIEDLRITPDGLFLRTTGEIEDIDQDNDRRPRQFILEVEDAVLTPEVAQRDIALDRYGITRIQLIQEDVDEGDEPVVRIVLDLVADSPNWRASVSEYDGIVLIPRDRSVVVEPVAQSQSLTAVQPAPIPVPDQPLPLPVPEVLDDRPALPDVSDSRVVVAIDPGHGGRDPGAVGINGLEESGIVLDIGLQVASLLEESGVTVLLTRYDDREIDLEPRVRAANQGGADLFVSIHANAISLDRPDVNGIETYYYSDSGERLAQVLHRNIVSLTDSRDRGVRTARFYVLRNTSMPAVLLEVGFVTGEIDAARLRTSDFRQEMAEAIAAGILQYVQQNF